jgi:hypothetical protein
MFSHLKRRIGVLTAVAVLAALVPTLSISPASAAASSTTQAMSDVTLLEACPAGTASAAGFTDTTSTDVDCIAMFGITQGTTATTYSPTDSVARWQMALFLTRMATVMSVTLGDGSDQSFTDISGKSAEIQTAINQLKQLGVTNGTTATTFSPDDNVSREQMAMFIERLLGNTATGPGGNSDDTATTNISGNGTTYNYTDIDSGTVTFEGHNSIVELYHLGVTDSATGATAYSPSADMTRAAMATFMTNALDHSNARPAGIVLQATRTAAYGDMVTASNELHVSNRDSSFVPIADTLVDVFGFTATTTLDEAAFAASGACKDALEAIGGSEELCLMENTDHVTNQTGNIQIEQTDIAVGANVAEGESTQYWAWTAAVGTYYGSTQTSSTVTVTSSKGGDFAHISLSNPYANLNGSGTVLTGITSGSVDAKMGSDVTITVQLRSQAGTATYNVAQAGCSINASSYTGTHGAAVGAIATTVIVTDANGAATFTASKTEPTALDGNDAATAQWISFTNNAAANVAAGCTAIGDFTYGATGATGTSGAFTDTTHAIGVKWDDEVRDNNSVVSSVSNTYVRATATGSGATNTVTATSYDQYGVGVANGSLGLTETLIGATSSAFTVTRTTNSSGSATFGVSRDAATSAQSTFRVNDDEDNNGSAKAIWTVAPSSTAIDASVGANSKPTSFVPTRAFTGIAIDNELEAQIMHVDSANDKMIVQLVGYDDVAAASVTQFAEYTWDSNDTFFIAGVAKTQAQWETGLAAVGLTALDDIYDVTNNGKLLVVSTSNVSEWRR